MPDIYAQKNPNGTFTLLGEDGQRFSNKINIGEYALFKTTNASKRTVTQNAAMHLYFEMLAVALNDAGLDMKKVLTKKVDILWAKSSVKEYLWRPVQEAMTGKESTTELNTVEPSDIHAALDRHLAEKFGVSVRWPSLR